jgi:Tol biopolymer transport system component
MSLFAFNLLSKDNRIVDTSSYWPDWSPSEMKLVFCSDKHLMSINGYRPQHLFTYNSQTGQIIRLTQGDFFTLNPDFSHDGKWIVYSSDEGNHGFFNLWRISADGSQKMKITDNLNLTSSSFGNVALGRPAWSPDDSYIYFNVLTDNNLQKGIYRIFLQNGKIEPVINSGWNDLSPAISPDNKRVAFFSSRSGTEQIWTYNLVTGEYGQITGGTGDYINSGWGKIEWLSDYRLLCSGYSSVNSRETIFTIDLN